MHEHIIRSAKAAMFLLFALSAAAYAYQYKRSVDNAYPGRTFSVEGVGEIESVPDVASFSVSVVSEGDKNVADVQKSNAEKMNRIDSYLKEQGIEEKDLKTSRYDVSPRYDYPSCKEWTCPSPVLVGYTITQSLEVRVRDTEKLGALLTGVVEQGGNDVSDVRFVMDDESAARDSARAEAIAEAKKKAESVAEAGGFRIGKLSSIYENSEAVPDYYYGGGAELSAKAAAPFIEPGTNTERVRMTLVYEIID